MVPKGARRWCFRTFPLLITGSWGSEAGTDRAPRRALNGALVLIAVATPAGPLWESQPLNGIGSRAVRGAQRDVSMALPCREKRLFAAIKRLGVGTIGSSVRAPWRSQWCPLLRTQRRRPRSGPLGVPAADGKGRRGRRDLVLRWLDRLRDYTNSIRVLRPRSTLRRNRVGSSGKNRSRRRSGTPETAKHEHRLRQRWSVRLFKWGLGIVGAALLSWGAGDVAQRIVARFTDRPTRTERVAAVFSDAAERGYRVTYNREVDLRGTGELSRIIVLRHRRTFSRTNRWSSEASAVRKPPFPVHE
jgi:hypothetical protein